jgi:hypothetical protein
MTSEANVLYQVNPGDLATRAPNVVRAIALAQKRSREWTYDERPQFYPLRFEGFDLENEVVVILVLGRIGVIIVDLHFWWSIGVLVYLAHGLRLSVDE